MKNKAREIKGRCFNIWFLPIYRMEKRRTNESKRSKMYENKEAS